MTCIIYVANYNTQLFLLQFDLMLSEDGSGRGAALVAAVAARRALEMEARR